MNVRQRLKDKLWNREIQNGVVIGLIVAAILAVVAWLGSIADPRSNPGIAWAAIKTVAGSALDWLNRPFVTTRLNYWSPVILVLGALFAVNDYRRRQVRALQKRLSIERTAADALRAAVPVGPPPLSSLDPKAIQVLRRLCRLRPGGETLSLLASHVSLQYIEAEKLLETMADQKLIEFHRVLSYGGGSSYWALTDEGRDYCLANGLHR